ncbi:putative leader peptide [Actinomycetospora soli]
MTSPSARRHLQPGLVSRRHVDLLRHASALCRR